jgi:hypothetical protein
MRSLLRSVGVALALALVCLGGGSVWAQPPAFVPFPEFLSDTASATLSEYPNGQVTDPGVFSQMQQYILSTLYGGVSPTGSFVLDSGTFDCVPVMQQPTVRLLGLTALASPPPSEGPPPPNGSGMPPGSDVPASSPLTLGLVDPYGNAISCPAGTIPMRRITLDEMTNFQTLQAFLNKSPNGGDTVPQGIGVGVSPVTGGETAKAEAPGTTGAGREAQPPVQAQAGEAHQYASGEQTVNNLGGSSWLNLWSPAVNQRANQTFSLSQQWYAGGAGNAQQTVEGGWQVMPAHYPTANAVTFIYWTSANYAANSGCYNLDCAGFVQVDNSYAIGGSWSNYSTAGGVQYIFRMAWQLFQNNWWLQLQGANAARWVGYYPVTLFNRGQMATNATSVTYGGETVGNGSWPPMGSGQLAARGWQQAAYQRQIYYFDLTAASRWTTLPPYQPSPACYTFQFFPGGGADWASYFFYGGPGGNGC